MGKVKYFYPNILILKNKNSPRDWRTVLLLPKHLHHKCHH